MDTQVFKVAWSFMSYLNFINVLYLLNKVFAHDGEKQKAEVTMTITVFFLFTWRVRCAARGSRSCPGLWRRKAAVGEQRGPGHRSPKDYSACWYGIPVPHLLHNAWWSPSRTRGCRTEECRVPQGGGGGKKQHQLWKRGGQHRPRCNSTLNQQCTFLLQAIQSPLPEARRARTLSFFSHTSLVSANLSAVSAALWNGV